MDKIQQRDEQIKANLWLYLSDSNKENILEKSSYKTLSDFEKEYANKFDPSNLNQYEY